MLPALSISGAPFCEGRIPCDPLNRGSRAPFPPSLPTPCHASPSQPPFQCRVTTRECRMRHNHRVEPRVFSCHGEGGGGGGRDVLEGGGGGGNEQRILGSHMLP